MCTLEKRGNIFILTLTGDDEHRLNPTLIDAIQATLRHVKAESTGNYSALITTAEGKFFSNGYDLAWAKSDVSRLRVMDSKVRGLLSELINFPMPTIAAVIGHACAGGFILALAHDYILMRNDRGFMYMSELDIGVKVPAWCVEMVKSKAGGPAACRDVIMKASKMTAKVAVEKGIVDSVYDGAAETVNGAVKLGEELVRRKWDGKLYGETRSGVMQGVVVALRSHDQSEEDQNANILNLSKL